MKRTHHTAEQMIRKLKTVELLIAQGNTASDVCRAIEAPTVPNADGSSSWE